MCAWFHMAKQGGIEYTDAQIVDLADHLNSLFGADFHESSNFWTQARTAYANWHTKYWSRFPVDEQPKHMSFSKNWRNGGAFLWHQLRKTWNGPVPKMNYDIAFKPAEKDLF